MFSDGSGVLSNRPREELRLPFGCQPWWPDLVRGIGSEVHDPGCGVAAPRRGRWLGAHFRDHFPSSIVFLERYSDAVVGGGWSKSSSSDSRSANSAGIWPVS